MAVRLLHRRHAPADEEERVGRHDGHGVGHAVQPRNLTVGKEAAPASLEFGNTVLAVLGEGLRALDDQSATGAHGAERHVGEHRQLAADVGGDVRGGVVGGFVGGGGGAGVVTGAGAGVVGAAVGGAVAAGFALVVGVPPASGGDAAGADVTAPGAGAGGAAVPGVPFFAGAVELAGVAAAGTSAVRSARLVGADGSGGGGGDPPAAT